MVLTRQLFYYLHSGQLPNREALNNSAYDRKNEPTILLPGGVHHCDKTLGFGLVCTPLDKNIVDSFFSSHPLLFSAFYLSRRTLDSRKTANCSTFVQKCTRKENQRLQNKMLMLHRKILWIAPRGTIYCARTFRGGGRGIHGRYYARGRLYSLVETSTKHGAVSQQS